MGKGKVLLLAVSIALGACSAENKVKQASEVAAAASAVVVASAVQSVKKYDGPFGLRMGIAYSELLDSYGMKLLDSDPGTLVGTPPNPSAMFGSYMYVAGPKTGLCGVIAYGKELEFNDKGDQIKDEVDTIAEALSVKYGVGKKQDTVPAAYKALPESWAMGNQKKNVYYGYSWGNGQILPKYISFIDIRAKSISFHSGVAMVRYMFNNFEECRKESVENQSSNL